MVGQVAADVALVNHAGQPASPGQHAQQRQLGQRHHRRAVVDQQDALARQRQLVPAARRRAVQRRQPRLPGVRDRVLDAVTRLVGELAEVDLPLMRRRGKHADVRTCAEDLLFATGEDDRSYLGVLEAQPLHDVVQLDIHAQDVRIELQLVAGRQAAGLVNVHRHGRDRPVVGHAPVPVALRRTAELDGVVDARTGLADRRTIVVRSDASHTSSPSLDPLPPTQSVY